VGSVAMLADAWHTLSDSLSSVVVLFGFWISGRPADDNHTFGHGRAEAVASVIIGTLLAVVGFSFCKESIQRLAHQRAVQYSTFCTLVFLISFAVKEGLARFSLWAGRKTGCASLIADAWHHRSDAVASLLIVFGTVVGTRLWWMDGLLGLGVSGLILYASYATLRSSASLLLGESPSTDLIGGIEAAVAGADVSVDRASVHHLHVHRYGDHVEITIHARVPGDMTVAQSHRIATRLEDAIRAKVQAETTVHIEPEHGHAAVLSDATPAAPRGTS
jgi:cation diffusion facilitator family transporter